MTDVGSWALKSLDDSAIPLKKMSLQADIKDLLMFWKVSQTFRNTTDKTIEATYTFPTAWSAVLTEFVAVVGGERLVGQAMPRANAEEEYESAHEDGDLPILLNAAEDGIASVTLGNLAPQEEVTLELSFLTLLAPVNGIIRVTLPFSAGERYSSDGRQGNLEPHEEIETSLTAEYPVQADFHITGALTDCQVSVPTHPASYSKEDDGVRITVKKAFADRNLTLLFEGVPSINAGYLAEDPFREGGWAAACVFTPPAGSERKSLRVDIVADCSGSMDGVGVVKMREALAALTDVLTKDDEITLTRFGSSVESVIASPRAFTSLFVRRSFQPAVSRIEADLGGTELGEALHTVLERKHDLTKDHHQRIVLLITDGEVWQVEQILEEVTDRAVPIFVVGVGACAAEGHLQKIATASGGLCEVVTHAEEMTPALERLVSSARHELLKLSLDEELSQQCIDPQPWQKNGYCGTAVRLFMRFAQRPEGLPILHISSQKEASSLIISDWTHIHDDGALAKAAAYAEYAVSPYVEEYATQYGLLTADTSLLLVKEREASQKHYSEELVRVPQMASMPLHNFCLLRQPIDTKTVFCSQIYHQMPPTGADRKPLSIPLLNPFAIFSKKRQKPMLGLDALDSVGNPLTNCPADHNLPTALSEDLEEIPRIRPEDFEEEFGFTPLVQAWSEITEESENGLVAPGFWQTEISGMSADTFEALKQLVQEQYPQLSDDQCRLLVPAVMVLLVAATCRRPVLHEPLVIAAQDLMFSMLGPDDGKWKQLKEPFRDAYDKMISRGP